MLRAAEQRSLRIEKPPAPGRYRVVGTFFFNPGILDAPDKIRIVSLPETNVVDLTLLESGNWPGGGVMHVTVGFMAAHDDLLKLRYVAEWSGAKHRQVSEIDKSLPALRMEMEEDPAGNDSAVPVGTMIIKVRRYPEVYYYWYLLPIAAIVLTLLYRRFKYFRN